MADIYDTRSRFFKAKNKNKGNQKMKNYFREKPSYVSLILN